MNKIADTKALAAKIIACETPHPDEVAAYLNEQMHKRICFLDGGMGTRIHAEEEHNRRNRFTGYNKIDANGIPVCLKGNNDLL